MNAPLPFSERPQKWRLRVEDFELLEADGAFAEVGKAELIDGDIYVVNAQFARHGLAKGELFYRLRRRLEELDSPLAVYSEVLLRVAPDSMPEPDLFLAPRQGYGPVPLAGVVLVIEVADTTLIVDLGRKAELYAAAGIPEYWVVDVEAARVLLHSEIADGRYGQRVEVPFGRPLVAATVPELDLGVIPLVG